MKVEVWTDIHCPWCYLGKRRFEKAFANFDHRGEVEIIWRSYELDPNAPRQYNGTVNDVLSDIKGISRKQAEGLHQQLTALAAQEGLDYRFDVAKLGNSFDAHRLIHLAAQHGLQDKMQERLFKAYFTDGVSVSDFESLIRLAEEVGLDRDEVQGVLNSNAYADDVRADEDRAAEIGIRGVPFFLFDERYAVSGAQRQEVFSTALNRTWEDLHHVIQIADGDQEVGVCDDENCLV